MMIADIVAAVKAAAKKMEKVDDNVYLVAGCEEATGGDRA